VGEGANSLEMMSVEVDDTIDKGHLSSNDGDYHRLDHQVSALEDGMSVLSEIDSCLLTIGIISSKNWMNGLQ
jgi:hypothetical protein